MIKPLGKRILIKTIDELTKTKTGIILKDSTTESDIKKGVVIEVSSEITELKKDDIVYYPKYKGDTIKIDDTEYIVIEEKDILGKEIK